MSSSMTDRNEYFKLLSRTRGRQKNKPLTVVQTPVGGYFGFDTLEGFASDAEYLGRAVGEKPRFDNEFYQLYKDDTACILEFETENVIMLPKMKIIDTEMKKGKAGDIYKCTSEHPFVCWN